MACLLRSSPADRKECTTVATHKFLKILRAYSLILLLVFVALACLPGCRSRERAFVAADSPCDSALLVTHAWKCLSDLR
jgi:hypothetical protein